MREYLKLLAVKVRADLRGAHKSLTIWFNSVGGALTLLLPLAQDQFPQLQEYLPANLYHYLMGAVVLGNIILRFKTTQALKDKALKKDKMDGDS